MLNREIFDETIQCLTHFGRLFIIRFLLIQQNIILGNLDFIRSPFLAAPIGLRYFSVGGEIQSPSMRLCPLSDTDHAIQKRIEIIRRAVPCTLIKAPMLFFQLA